MVASITFATVGCEERAPEHVGAVRLAVEEPSQEGTDELAFSDPQVRMAVEHYLDTMTGAAPASEMEDALAAVAGLDDMTRTEQLAAAFDATDLSQKWVVLFVMSKVPSAGGLAWAGTFFTSVVYDEYDAYLELVEEEYADDLGPGMKLVVRALQLVANCHEAAISGADDMLLSVASEHGLAPVRRAAIREIEVRGDAGLKAELRTVIQPADEAWLDPEPFPMAHTIELDERDSAFDDPEEVSR